MVMEQEKTTNTPLKIDWKKVWRKHEEPTPDLVIQPAITATKHLEMDSDRQHLLREELQKLSDGELEDKIRRMKHSYETISSGLPDKGKKYRHNLVLSEEEREFRKLRRVEKVFLLRFDSLLLIHLLALITPLILVSCETWKMGNWLY